MKERQLFMCTWHACDNIQRPFMCFYKYIDQVCACVSFTIYATHTR